MTLVEASNHLLGTFDRRLVDYVGRVFHERKVRVLTDTSVVKVRIAKGVGSGERRLMINVHMHSAHSRYVLQQKVCRECSMTH